ncbi:hypothetical protein [Desulfosporosinus sp.]|uniref:hypothetical protein n=1 Tax=Desulfosporosinus sp. TaxID=157907 RepID=UPI00230F8B12|nr:hypothetical protein [Desulfosporosinus sp.]MDA8222486.1 hypothetical protein [Desulfitobacterium hafniense]
MEKDPILLLKSSLLLPLNETQKRLEEIRVEVNKTDNEIVNNGLFLMAVAFLESMIREMLIYCLKYYPEKIPGHEIKVDTKKLSGYEGFHFLEKLISDYLELMPFKDLGKLFFQALGIKKPSPEVMDSIIKIKDIRNSLVHNNLQFDYKHKRSVNRTNENLMFCLDTYSDFINTISNQIEIKYSKFTRIEIFKELWRYTFRTPLCKKIEDYWLLDEEKDLIVAIKNSKQEGSLSSSEKFLLDIWRGQFNNHNVHFLNMSSLGTHAQKSLYLFLKVSNDIFMYG